MIKINDHVRILAYPSDHINAYGRVNTIYGFGDGKLYHVVNMNMPYQGTISTWFHPHEIAPKNQTL